MPGRLRPEEGAIFEEGGGAGGADPGPTAQVDVVSRPHGECRTLQDHWFVWTQEEDMSPEDVRCVRGSAQLHVFC